MSVSASVNLPLHHKVEVLFWHQYLKKWVFVYTLQLEVLCKVILQTYIIEVKVALVTSEMHTEGGLYQLHLNCHLISANFKWQLDLDLNLQLSQKHCTNKN